jgi:hypothetical protein
MTEREAIRQEIYAERELLRRIENEKPLAQVIGEVLEASGHTYQPIEQAAGPRVAYYMDGNSRFGVLRRVVLPEPIERDAWGAKIQ